MEQAQKETVSMMAIDKKREHLFDISDATKVNLKDNRIIAIDKKLNPYDAIDIGAAVCTPQIFQELSLQWALTRNSCSHSDGMRRLASKGLLLYHDIGQDLWEDVDEPQAFKAAEKLLYQSLRKPTDGFLSRHVERYLSLSITRLLAQTPLLPNHVTFLVIGVGAQAAYLFASAAYETQVLGALVFWASSFLDGCDGELARLKFLESRFGGWLDLWGDNLIHIMVFAGIGIGLFRATGTLSWLYGSALAVFGVFLSVFWVSLKTLKGQKGSGPLFTSVVNESQIKKDEKITYRLIQLANTLSRRDFIFWLIFITLLGWQGIFLWCAAIGSITYFLTLIFIDWRLKHSHA
jgi:CDP-L-myo-inositol myo-inositolphosphotransferase